MIPAQLELTDRALVGVFSEPEAAPPRCAEIELDAIENIWFMTVRWLRRGGRVRKNVRWVYRHDPFGVLSQDQEIRGLRIRAEGRTYKLWVERLGDEDSIRPLCTGIQQWVRDRLFPAA